MTQQAKVHWEHAPVSRRAAIQAGAVGLLGLGTNHLHALRAAAHPQDTSRRDPAAKAVIYIFLSGGLAQQDSFDMKPRAPENVRGEFRPIATETPGVDICEHLPKLAARSRHWSLVRSLTHPYNEHSDGHLAMLCGRTPMPPAFDRNQPLPSDWPSIAALAGRVTHPRNNMPPAVVLPERLIHRTGRVIPGQGAGQMGDRHDPWYVLASPFNGTSYGAFPEFEFHHERGAENLDGLSFQAPHLSLPEGLNPGRVDGRLHLLSRLQSQTAGLEQQAEVESFDRYRQQAVSLLADPKTQRAFDVVRADEKTLDRYGRNSFGWSLLMARRLVEAGVNLVQVNLGNNETWDTHQAAFRNLRDFLFPPTDLAVSALLDDLHDRGLLEQTLVVMAGEFGRTPKVFKIPGAALPGRDHWGAAQTVWLAGGGVQGGRVIGATDKLGGHPTSAPQTPENLAATIYGALGIPATAAWKDDADRPHHVYQGDPIAGLT